MTCDLPGLPIELLLQIVRCEDADRTRRYLCETLRLTCKELDSKIVRYFGSKHYRLIKVPHTEPGLTRLLCISQGQLADHVKSVTIDYDLIITEHQYACSSRPSDFSEHSWYQTDEDAGNHWRIRNPWTKAPLSCSDLAPAHIFSDEPWLVCTI
jgi:hypothetical protein